MLSDRIVKLTKNKYFPFALVLYVSYIILLSFLAFPSISEIQISLNDRGGVEITRTTPFIYFGIAALTPFALLYFILEIRRFTMSFALNSRILIYITFFLLFQLGVNILLAVCLVVLKADLLDVTTYTFYDFLLVWTTGCIFTLITLGVTIFTCWKWIQMGLEKPRIIHWFLGYIIYLICVCLSIIFIQTLDPSVEYILFWPLTGVGIVGTLNLFIASFGLFTDVLVIMQYTMFSGVNAGYILFIFVMVIFFLLFVILLPIVYLLIFYFAMNIMDRFHDQNRTDCKQ
ncbi:MAG: hypothetical protein ACFFAE_15860 [Candidatus Hodarchaeota archaeon]